ncbi:HlyD family type I secretion periplasmic adaptor subunit [Serratia fonticola]|uniref:HlyD family type I secretion periplasmic adaptor subunit n=1 Tax=Serratia fonticola TaxID=47917 RepID=UPI00217722BE|nr:HlyD family type I secretion periplasmic adaptor subunit [Serratia fonticola]CAI1618335.1 Hemolysin secretion protein D, chromosomal [Serratia fonticola]
MKLLLEGLRHFIQRYKQTFREVWKVRLQLDSPARTADELAFRPAHLELIETPVSPLPRWSMRAIMLFVFIALAWSIVGHMDVVAVASGKTITSGRTRIIQPLEPSIVKAIHARDGQHVKQGQVLVELDATTASAELQRIQEALNTARMSLARYTALLSAVRRKLKSESTPRKTGNNHIPRLLASSQQQLRDEGPIINAPSDIPATQKQTEQALLTSQYQAFISQVDKQKLLIQQKSDEIVTLKSQITKATSMLALAETKTADYRRLYDKKFASKHEWLAQEQEKVSLQNELFIQRNRLQELSSAIEVQKQELSSIEAQFINNATEKLNQARDSIAQYEQEIAKNQKRKDILRLTSPVSGTVQQLAIHSVGGVVTEAQPLLAVVPDNEEVEVEVMIGNLDIGFIKKGQVAAIKIASFPYTRYGYLEGVVTTVSHDAVQDEKRGLLFPATILMKQSFILIDGVRVNLRPGMEVTAEIKTRQRRVIDYFLSPLRQYTSEAMRER